MQALRRAPNGLRTAVVAGTTTAILSVVGVVVGHGLSFGQAGQPVTVSPAEGDAFTEVAVSGAGCTGTDPGVSGALFGPPAVGSPTGSFFQVQPGAGGDWAATFTVPPFAPAGAYELRVSCSDNPGNTAPRQYAPAPFTILPSSTQPAMSVAPTTAPAGSAVVLAVEGTLCRGAGAEVEVRIFERVPAEEAAADEFVARGTFTPDGGGDWSGQLTIPASAGAGTYGVSGICQVGGQQFFLYQPVPEVTLTTAAGPARPVTGRPPLTG